MNSSHTLFSDSYLITHTISPKHSGMRLDAFLKKIYRRKSREHLKRAIEKGSIHILRTQSPHLSVGKLKASTVLLPGDEVQVVSPRRPEPPVNFDYKILYEDEYFLVINKAAPLPVHPAGRYFFHTLLTHLRTQGFTIPIKADRELYLVHRIDKETSGVIILAKSRDVCNHLVQQFFSRTTEKTYLAIVHGHVEKTSFEVDLAIGRRPHSAIALQMFPMNVEEGGLPALTRFETLQTFETDGRIFTLLKCKPKTGRQHQIRVHLQSIGHPIVGDKLYSLPPEIALRFYDEASYHGKSFYRLSPEMMNRLVLIRHALHAAAIRFRHPFEDRFLEFHADLPDDLTEFLSSPSEIKDFNISTPALLLQSSRSVPPAN